MKSVILILLLSTYALTAVENCKKEYDPSDTLNKGCEICNDGYFQEQATALQMGLRQQPAVKTWRCTQCPAGCSTCSSKTTCVTCDRGYYLPPLPPSILKQGATRVCLKCSSNCSECKSDKVCDVCVDGFFPKEKTALNLGQQPAPKEFYCTRCTQNGCKTCANDVCSACTQKGFYPKTTEGKLTCETCPKGCTECSNENTCSACDTKFYINLSKCESCHESCTACLNSATNCKTCEKGYSPKNQEKPKLTFDVINQVSQQQEYVGECMKCPEKCTLCKTTDTCETCESGYKWEAGEKICKFDKVSFWIYIGCFVLFIALICVCICVSQKQKSNNNRGGSYHEEQEEHNEQYQSFAGDKEEENPIGI